MMRTPGPLLPAALAASIFAARLTAQADGAPSFEPPRGPVLGAVRDAAGDWVAGACVMLVSWPLGPRTDVGSADIVRVKTDGKGRFRTAVLVGRAYSASATWTDGEGTARRTTIAESVTPGPPRILDEAPLQTLRRIAVKGRAAWAGREPLRIMLSPGGENPAVVAGEFGTDDVVAVPTMAGGYLTAQVWAGGLLIGFGSFAFSANTKVEFALPAPTRAAIIARDEG
ncbi:MAG: hypothetical protein KDC98_24265, partial [Planctomycetes bacterium]|nr:hypothetical protein [Planctomycetota bacterium]